MIGIILSGKFINPELKQIFGEIVPSQIPLGNKSILEIQVDFLDKFCESIYLFSPEPLVNDTRITHIQSTQYQKLDWFSVIKLLLEKKPFKQKKVSILCGDSIIIDPKLKLRNGIYLCKTTLSSKYDNVDGDTVIGLFSISTIAHRKILMSSKNKQDYFYHKLNEYQYINSNHWLELDSIQSYYNARAQFIEARSFNKLKLKDNYIIKTSSHPEKINRELDWLSFYKAIIPKYIPFAEGFKDGGYKIQYLNLNNLSEIFCFGRLTEEDERRYLYLCKEFLDLLSNVPLSIECMNCEKFIHNKLISRYHEILELKPELHKPLEQCLAFFGDYRCKVSPWHGDFCFSNILYNYIDEHIIVIDPRGALENMSIFSPAGPKDYDLWKLAHSYVYGYDYIITHSTLFEADEIKRRTKIFCEIFQMDSTNLKFGVLQLFISMIPLHKENQKRCDLFTQVALNIYNSIK